MAHSEERGYRPSFLLISYTLYFYLRARRCKSALCLLLPTNSARPV